MGKRDIPSPNENIAPRTIGMRDVDLTAAPAKKAKLDTGERIAVSGRVASVKLTNFMCHANLQIDFKTAQNNCFYIGGPNGSGKSALFAAINLGLGGRGSDNDRGNTVKSYIKDGTTQSKITITLTNAGLNAHPDFDDLISIERTINQASSTYIMKSVKVTSSDNHVERIVSRKKADVDRIVSRFSIHLSNPAFWMSQDRSRSFLANFKPANVYKLYLESTNLENIRLSYIRFADALDECFALIQLKAGEILNEQKKLKRMQEQRDLQAKLDQDRALVASFCWKLLFCKVRDYNDQIELTLKKQEAQKTLQDETKKEYAKNRAARTEVEKKIQEFRDEVEVQDAEIAEAREDLDAKKRKVLEFEEKIRECEQSIRKKTSEKKYMERTIVNAKNEVRILLEKQGNQDLTKRLTKVENDYKDISQQRENMELGGESAKLREKLDTVITDYKRKEEEKYTIQRDINQLRRKIEQDMETMRRSRATKKDAINKFGSHMAEILMEINRSKSRFQTVPKGPLGKYITLIDPKWAFTVEECIGNLANNFLCSSHLDAEILRNIFQSLRIPAQDRPTIIVAKCNGRAYTNLHEPSSDFKSIYRVLKFSDPDVHNVIIDKSNCEQFILIEDKTEAMELMGSNYPPQNAVKAYTLDGSQAYANGPNSQYRFYSGRGGHARGTFGNDQGDVDEGALARLIEDTKSEAMRLETQDLRKQDHELKVIYNERDQTKAAIDEFDRKLSNLRSQELQKERQAKDLRAELAQTANEDQVENLNESIEEMQKKIPLIEDEVKDILKNVADITADMAPVIQERKEAEHTLAEIQKETRDFASKSQKLQNELSKYDDAGEILKIRLDKVKADEGVFFHTEAKLKSERDDAMEMVENDKKNHPMPPGETDPPDLSSFPSTTEAQRKIEEMQKAVDRATVGCDTTITLECVKDFKDKLKRLKYLCRMIEDVLIELKNLHAARVKAYPSLKKFTELKVCNKFQELLAVRGHFIGGLEFDHEKETLNVNVQSSKEKDAMAGRRPEVLEVEEVDEHSYDDDSDDSTGPRRKKSKKSGQKKKRVRDLKGLSGGERSFVTAALVMSLWEVMEQPFRMMDEFDVFMDMMNRKLVMDLLVELATKKFPHNQFIFFTPQGIKELNMVDGLQVFEMNRVRD
ncbi:Structural maintenance of chromosomes protein 6 homolog smc-6 [Caenorhabditis elegans]|uniref:Structural maintenance of chromosomes protein 6 homolog smc-6 n=1 Tax=Caenorhabditis elegans TaxID=6239 RepID=SMC6_CAEEL|nr:Structural maintenance of chromosomes protein 6 homolog smc-6 [Caenorhabditis elegans]G5EG17.1 RecName: Full=Structural maintenance of chromosomes protein 6 homolog smc-6 [Caenorhabditis elegans]CAA91339.2 Structural maintenance of chromosomes protein 6 homolog smc-6 [Caenorhabditis elegans]|eukprot:NP_496476.2 Structural maintenance of chromosomes protein 6 homolog smc-6 [Caenorhabditis elegans]